MSERSSPSTISQTFSPAPPNNALQRTEAGGRLFSVYRVFLRQPLSLSLEALGPESSSQCSPMASVFPFALSASLSFQPAKSLRSAFPSGSALHSPAGVHVRSTFVRSVGAGLTTRSSEQPPAVPLVSIGRALRRRCLSLSLSPLGPATLSDRFFEGERVPAPFVAGGESVPSSSQHQSVPVRAVPWARSSFRWAGSFAPPFPAAAPSFPRRSPRGFFRRSRGPL